MLTVYVLVFVRGVCQMGVLCNVPIPSIELLGLDDLSMYSYINQQQVECNEVHVVLS